VIDTLAKSRKPGKGDNVYVEDYGALESLMIGRISSIKHPYPTWVRFTPDPFIAPINGRECIVRSGRKYLHDCTYCTQNTHT
jgi:hypothetical protein